MWGGAGCRAPRQGLPAAAGRSQCPAAFPCPAAVQGSTPPEQLPVWVSWPLRIKAKGRLASLEQAAAVQRGEVLEGHVVMWGNTAFESRSNEGITAQQEEVRAEVR